jgi:hypothetical protein
VKRVVEPNIVEIEGGQFLKWEPDAGENTWREVVRNANGNWAFRLRSSQAHYSRYTYTGKERGPTIVNPHF